MTNIEEFNLVVGEIFGDCYRSFPRGAHIINTDIVNLIREESGKEYDPTEIDFQQKEHKIVESTVSWLIRAGYLWDETPPNSNIPFVRLSPKGLEVLNSTPEALASSETLGQALAKGVGELGRDVLFNLVNTALATGIASVLNA